MEARSHIKFVRISPLKLRTLRDDIKALGPQAALNHLQLSNKRSAKVLYRAIKAAVDSGKERFQMNTTQARFKELMIDEGPSLKRFRPGSRGTAKPYKRKSSHITVVIEDQTPEKKPLPVVAKKK
ncbi:hypothetical protein A3F34_03070 [Candidatus Roizmanbacteria bacterium RIFCSPHIGHO2_12_FULL_44_10]|uniref:Large ribosomal subunit protein uL22 n=1 Tax=Candidatus Roizmanbacteria bacterium RIFCSPHIGHO2_12_FULL_44_10 TaxID=1802054 RepID=A0A1F7I8F3_9BACT|nr:MAG: hypothetical protein A3F34_03070 [Candidatus Roizmanbacteria bacterium RIFCSPHIGHO2_12_FULL_44_10]